MVLRTLHMSRFFLIINLYVYFLSMFYIIIYLFDNELHVLLFTWQAYPLDMSCSLIINCMCFYSCSRRTPCTCVGSLYNNNIALGVAPGNISVLYQLIYIFFLVIFYIAKIYIFYIAKINFYFWSSFL